MEKYPYEIHVCVLLLDNMIVNWKISSTLWDSVNIAFNNRQPMWLLKETVKNNNMGNLSVEYETHTCNNSQENQAIFRGAMEFYKKWKLHPNFNLSPPYDTDLAEKTITKLVQSVGISMSIW